eukprot:TRINITY_DN5876_c0_g1_i4.p1 TRINITY_DN5876_c0_g1~~TRINITY_DN5876_c0_g1_i4.p1  ORF type:complete len:220 (+),score=25.44 TRINITY_DN5876_c0_g1_i4:342-1001(+)
MQTHFSLLGLLINKSQINTTESVFLGAIWNNLYPNEQILMPSKSRKIYKIEIKSFDRLSHLFGWQNLVTFKKFGDKTAMLVLCPRGHAKYTFNDSQRPDLNEIDKCFYAKIPVIKVPIGQYVGILKILHDKNGKEWALGYRTVNKFSTRLEEKRFNLFGVNVYGRVGLFPLDIVDLQYPFRIVYSKGTYNVSFNHSYFHFSSTGHCGGWMANVSVLTAG